METAYDGRQAIQHAPADSVPGAVRQRILARRGKQAKNIAKVAACSPWSTTGCATGRSAAWPPPQAAHRQRRRNRRRHDQAPLQRPGVRGRRSLSPAVTFQHGASP